MGFLFATLFALVPLIWLPQTSELFEFNKLMTTYILAVLIGGIWLIRMIREKRIIFKRTILDIPLLVFLFSNLLSLSLSIDPHVSWYGYYSRWNGGLLSLLTYAFLYWAFVSNMTKKSTLSLVTLSLVTAAIISVYGILEHFGRSISCLLVTPNHVFDVSCWVQDVQNRVYATLGQPNWMAAYLVVLIFMPLANFQFSKSNFQKIFNFPIFIILFLSLLFTKSRSGLLAFGISSSVFWGYLFIIHKSKFIIHSIIFALCILLFSFVIKNPIRDLILRDTYTLPLSGSSSLETGGTESGSIRKIVWLGAYRIWTGSAKNFLIGTGPETFAQSYYQYRPTEHNQTSEWELLYNKAHNEYLNQLATTGLLGLISYIVLLATMLLNFQFSIYNLQSIFNLKIFKPIENSLKTENWYLKIALFAGWLTILVTNFWGFSVVITQLFLFLFPAISISLEQQSDKVTKKQEEINFVQLFAIFGTVSVTLLLCYFVANYWYADVLLAKGSNAIRSYGATQDPEYIVLAYQSHYDASKTNPGEPAILSEFGLSASYLALAMQGNATNAALLANQADKATLASINISPFHPNYYKNRARAMIILSKLDLAEEALLAAQKISPTDPRIPYNLGLITKDKKYFQQALDLKPNFLDAQKALEEK